MIPMNPRQILQAARNGANPNQLIMQLVNTHPAVRRAKQLMNGKTPAEIRDMAQQEAQRLGIDLNQIAEQWGVKLPE